MHCTTCGLELSSTAAFCEGCGEVAHPHRLDIKHVLHEFVHAFLHADKGIFLLVKELALQPGKSALAYTAGSRRKYLNPVTFLLITGGMGFFLRYKLGFRGVSASKKVIFFLGEFMHQFSTPIVILTIPLLSLYSWLFFRSSGKNYAENMVMNMFMMGEYHLFNMLILTIPSYFLPGLNGVFSALAITGMLVYFYFTCRHFFKQDAAATIWKSVGTGLLYVLSFAMLMGVAFVFFLIKNGVHIKDLQ
jgi:Protein of unknown function (DUF3667)